MSAYLNFIKNILFIQSKQSKQSKQYKQSKPPAKYYLEILTIPEHHKDQIKTAKAKVVKLIKIKNKWEEEKSKKK